MNLLFIWPPGNDPSVSLPLPYAFIKAQLSVEHQCHILDYSLTPSLQKKGALIKELVPFQPDLIIISVLTHLLESTLILANELKTLWPQARFLWGGQHPTLAYQDLLDKPFVDYIFRGEADFALQELASSSFRTEALKKISGLCFKDENNHWVISQIERLSQDKLDQLNFPDFNFIKIKEYWKNGYAPYTSDSRSLPLWLSRGCSHHCHYCSVPALGGGKQRHFSSSYILQLINFLQRDFKVHYFNIFDDNFLEDREHVKELLTELAIQFPETTFSTPRGLRIDSLDSETLILLKKAGWKMICLAQESGSDELLKSMNKTIDTIKIKTLIHEAKKINLKTIIFFIVGHPGEDKESFKESLKMVRELKPDFFHCFYFQPLVGTRTRKQLIQSGQVKENFITQKFSEGNFFSKGSALSKNYVIRSILFEYILLFSKQPKAFLKHLNESFSFLWLLKKIFLNLKNSRQ